MKSLASLLAILAMAPGLAMADVKLPGLIADGMVLQQQTSANVWGTAAPQEKVTVTFRGQSATTSTDAAGRWKLQVATREAGGPFPLTIAGTNTIELKNVLVGEVWIASGQSNMGWPVATRAGAAELQGTANSSIRLFTVPPQLSDEPQRDVAGQWFECGPNSLLGFSAVAYYFGRQIQSTQHVPVALIHASYGGSGIESWTSAKTLQDDPGLSAWRDARAHADLKSRESQARLRPEIDRYEAALAEAKRKGTALPAPPRGMQESPKFSRLYNGMLAPLTQYTIRGAIWYQGEANAGRPDDYQNLFAAMIRGWRSDWAQGDFPFLFVQIAPFKKIVDAPQESTWARLREAQLKVAQSVPKTGMVVVTDWGHETDIHVKDKQPVGERLAILARALVYGESLAYSGPEFAGMSTAGGHATLKFKHSGEGLMAKRMVLENITPAVRGVEAGGSLHVVSDDGTGVALRGFTIAGEDRKFVPAVAEIHGDTVVVSSPLVPQPKAVRYGWADYPTGNLFNRAGLPASPFRTDDWPATQ